MSHPSLLSCTRCKAALPGELYNLDALRPCPSCGAELQVEAFPALFHEFVVVGAQPLTTQGESSCFYHPNKKAAIPCDSCGRFLCSLCDLELNEQHVCPACLETGQKKGKLKDLQNSRVCYDKLALTLATLPAMICLWPSIVGAPFALYVALRYRNAPCGIRGKSTLCFTLAIVLASLQIVAWLVALFYVLNK